MKKIALITGITGQDGSYLAKFLLKKNYIVHGLKRRSSSPNSHRIDDIYEEVQKKNKKFYLHYGDLTDSSNLNNLISKIKPHEIYNLAAQSHVKLSFDTPEYTAEVCALGALRILETIRSLNLENKTKFYQASSSEMFGNNGYKNLSEKSKFEPCSPYATSKLFAYWITKNYRESYGMHAVNGILFNHESPLRGETFVSKKITKYVANYKYDKSKILYLGNLYSIRDWGHAKDYVEGMWKIINHKKADDFVLSTGVTCSVKKFVEMSFAYIGATIVWKNKGLKEIGIDKKTNKIIVKVDKRYFRPNELNYLKGNSKKALKQLNWSPKITLKRLIKEMVDYDLKLLSS